MKDGQWALSVLVENQPGALIRVSSLFSRRGINISRMYVHELKPDLARILLVADSRIEEKDLICRQLAKIYDVKKLETAQSIRHSPEERLLLRRIAGSTGRSAQLRAVRKNTAGI